MTATRTAIGATLAALWLAAVVVLWRTEVPSGLGTPTLDAGAIFPAGLLERNDRYAGVLRVTGLLALAAQLATLAALAGGRRRLAALVPGPVLLRAAALGALVALALALARLPFGLAALWWRRREGVARAGYDTWLLDRLPGLGLELGLAALAGAALVLAARLAPRRWWFVLWGALVALAAAWVLAGPAVLSPRLEPLRDERLAAEIEALGGWLGLDDVQVEVRDAASRTRALNAEALGVGPTTTVVLWDTLLRPPVTEGEVRFIAAHELAHVARRHPQKGVAWFALLALPCAWLVGRVVGARGGAARAEAVPLAALVAALCAVALLPVSNAISRRYEREADWLALQATGDPAAAERLLRRFAETSRTDPEPPALLHAVLGTHPSLVERIELSRAAASRAGPGSP